MRPRIANVLCVFFLVLTAQESIASQQTPVINRFGQAGLLRLHSAQTLGMGRLVVNAHASMSADRDYISGFDFDSEYHPRLLTYNALPSIGYGLTNFLDLSLTMPVYWDHILDLYADSLGWSTGGVNAVRGGLGDLELSGKFQYPPYPHQQAFEVAFFGALSVPTGGHDKGYFPRQTYYVTDASATADTNDLVALFTSTVPELDLKMLWTLDLNQLNRISPVLLHTNFGARFVMHGQLQNTFLLNLAFEYRPARWMTLFTEFSGETRMSNLKSGFRLGDDPLRLSPGLSFTAPGGFVLTLGGDINLCSDTTLIKYLLDEDKLVSVKIEPRWRALASIGWAGFVLPQDRDHDGITDSEDRCPQDPEDLDGFQDDDGCPDPDNDNDGITDLRDKCPKVPEDKDGFADDDGCPETDNDRDGIPDSSDQCPSVAEDHDGFEDENGCPDPDNDNDNVADSTDRCINIREDRDGFRDEDGCPDFDNDEDGIPDSLDRCPDTKGTVEAQGCPEEKPKPKEIKRGRVVLSGVNFESGSDVLTGDSYAILEQVFESLREWPEVRVEIRGHTDSVGNNDANRELSKRRAGAVRQYLIMRGIEHSRLKAEGHGEDDPIAENKTAEGRAINRRVELHRVD